MGDESLKKGQTLTDCVYQLVSLCHKNVLLRDEVYCQLIKQSTADKNTKQNSLLRAWRLFTIITAYFACSETLKPYLVKYLTDIAQDNRRLFHGLLFKKRFLNYIRFESLFKMVFMYIKKSFYYRRDYIKAYICKLSVATNIFV